MSISTDEKQRRGKITPMVKISAYPDLQLAIGMNCQQKVQAFHLVLFQ